MLIVGCPSEDLIPPLVSNPAWDRLYAKDSANSDGGDGGGGGGGGTGGEGGAAAPCLVHLAPAEVLRSREYGEWARKFGGGATHIVAAQPFCSPHSAFQVIYLALAFVEGWYPSALSGGC